MCTPQPAPPPPPRWTRWKACSVTHQLATPPLAQMRPPPLVPAPAHVHHPWEPARRPRPLSPLRRCRHRGWVQATRRGGNRGPVARHNHLSNTGLHLALPLRAPLTFRAPIYGPCSALAAQEVPLLAPTRCWAWAAARQRARHRTPPQRWQAQLQELCVAAVVAATRCPRRVGGRASACRRPRRCKPRWRHHSRLGTGCGRP